MSKIISGSQTGSESRMQVISRADFQPGLRMLLFVVRIDMVADIEAALRREVAENSLAA
jgi:hypothetical protein